MNYTVSSLIAIHDAEAFAIGAPDREWMTYGGLRDLSANVTKELHGFGVGRGDRVAIVLPNGPEMATAFVTIAQTATTAPLNPAYRQEEYEFYLEDLKAKVIVVADDYDGPAVLAAEKFGVAVLRLSFNNSDPAGCFTLSAGGKFGDCDNDIPTEDDVALILHTSGMTSRPKIVPLLHSNLFASAHNVRTSLALTQDDRCLNVMPMFHIHGLIAAVSGLLAAVSLSPIEWRVLATVSIVIVLVAFIVLSPSLYELIVLFSIKLVILVSSVI